MKILLIVGSANDIFITNMTKWLKASMTDSTIDIFEFFPTTTQENNTYFDDLGSSNSDVWFAKVKGINSLYPYYASYKLKRFLKGKHYDVIQCHWLTPPLVVTRNIHKHCNKLFATFWGGELDGGLKLLFSERIYRKYLNSFITKIDYLISSNGFKSIVTKTYPKLATKHIEGHLGSAPLEELYNLMEHEDKLSSKEKLSINTNKKTLLIGYSGKSLHQHLPIIEALAQRDELKSKIHILAPMTRGGGKIYCDKVDSALQDSGYTYTLLRDRYLSDGDIARLRNATDITLQLSKFDGFSRSIVECLCAKSVLVYGNWLSYKEHLINNGFIGHKVQTINEGIETVARIVDNIEQYKDEVENNSRNGKEKNLWSECIKDWVNAYISTK